MKMQLGFASLILLALAGCGGSTTGSGSSTPAPSTCAVSNTPSKAGNVIFRVTSLPANQPAADPVYLAGTMNKWNAGDAAWQLTKNCDGSLQVEVPYTMAGDTQQFKFTRGAWSKVEVDAQGYDVPNRTLAWDGTQQLVSLSIAKWADLEGGSKGSPPTATGDIRFHDIALANSTTTRRIRVYLPPDYKTNTSKQYPVLYMFDGQNLYDTKTSAYAMEWKVDETLEGYFKDGTTSGVIVVGIDNAGDALNRYDEYTAWNWTHPTLGAVTARGKDFAAWVVNTVMPLVNTTYRTLPDRANTGLAGSSMGGYMTVYTGISYPEKFGKLASLSTVALDDPMQGQLLRAYVEAANKTYGANTTVYLDIGDQESLPYTTSQLLVQNHTAMCESFQKAGYKPTCQIIAGGVHDESAWSKRFGSVFQILFPKTSQ